MTFTAAEREFLRSRTVGHFSTVGPAGGPQIRPVGVHLGADGNSIEVVGHALAQTQKWRNVERNPHVAFIVDNVVSVTPPEAYGIEIRGIATVHVGAGSTSGGLSGDIIRIEPKRVISWGINGPGTRSRTVAG